MIMSQGEQDQSPSAFRRRRPSGVLPTNPDHYGEEGQACPSPVNPASGSTTNGNTAGGEDRRNLQRSRYWRLREWTPVTSEDVSTEVNKSNETPTSSKKQENDTKGKKDAKKYDDEPPGFRWVEIRIVARKKRKPEAGTTRAGEVPENRYH